MNDNLKTEFNGTWLISCMSATSFLGRLIFGLIADNPKVNGVMLQQMALLVIGSCTMLLVAAQVWPLTQFFICFLFVKNAWRANQ